MGAEVGIEYREAVGGDVTCEYKYGDVWMCPVYFLSRWPQISLPVTIDGLMADEGTQCLDPSWVM